MSHFSVLVALSGKTFDNDLAFESAVNYGVQDVLAPYCECTDDPEYTQEEVSPDGEIYRVNPNATWDWYQIGGRWPGSLWVKAETTDIVPTDLSWCAKMPENPEGFKLVSGARMKDICWTEMKADEVKARKEKFRELSDILSGKKKPEGVIAVKEDGIYSWSAYPLLKRDETFEQYLDRKGLGTNAPFAIDTYAFVDKNGEWHSQGDMGWWAISFNDKEETSWNNECQSFLKALDPDDILVQIDCHI